MNNRSKIALVVGVVLIMFVLVWTISGDPEKREANRESFVSSNWTVGLQPFDKRPKGLFLFHGLLQQQLDSAAKLEVVSDSSELEQCLNAKKRSKTYLFVGNNFGLKTEEFAQILSDVETNGSTLFLAYNNLTDNLYPLLFEHYEEQFDYAPQIQLYTANGQRYKLYNLFQNDTIASDWRAFGAIVPKNAYVALSSFMEMDNFIRIRHGKGRVLLHTTPQVFFNYQIRKTSGYHYARYCQRFIPDSSTVYSLELARLSDNYGNEDVDDQSGTAGKTDDSYLRMIFESPTLLKAMLVALLTVLLFVLFRSKRVRPVVPYLPEKKDMTLAFADTITYIYFAKRNPYGMLQIQRKNFYNAILKHYFIDLSKRNEEKEVTMLSEKCNKPVREINALLELLETKEASAVSDEYVSQIEQKKRQFYIDTGILSARQLAKHDDEQKVFRSNLIIPGLVLLTGIILGFFGLYLLILSKGIGMLWIPPGLLLVLLGIVRLNFPVLELTDNEVIHHSFIGRKKRYPLSDLLRAEPHSNSIVLYFKDDKELIINRWELMKDGLKALRKTFAKLNEHE